MSRPVINKQPIKTPLLRDIEDASDHDDGDDGNAASRIAATPPLHVVYVSGGTDIQNSIADIRKALGKSKLLHETVIADASAGKTSADHKQALLDRLRSLFKAGKIGPDTRIIVQLHGGFEEGKFFLQANGVIDELAWDELEETIRRPTQTQRWNGEVILGCCEAGLLGESLPLDEGNYVLLAGKKSVMSESLTRPIELLIDFMGAHIRKKHSMPSSDKIWRFLTKASGENLRRISDGKLVKTKAGEAPTVKQHARTTGKSVLEEAIDGQPAMLLLSKLTHGSGDSVVRILQKHGKKLKNDPGLKAPPPLFALQSADIDIAKKVQALFAAGLSEICSSGHTIFHVAAQKDHIELMRALLSQDVEFDTPNRIGRTALHAAAALGRREIAELLLAHGADPTVTDKFGKTPLQYAEEKGQVELVKLLKPFTSNKEKYLAASDKENRRDPNQG